MADAQGHHLVASPGLKLGLVILPIPHPGVVIHLEVIGPAVRSVQAHRVVALQAAPLHRHVPPPVHAAAVTGGAVAGHGLAGVGRGEDVGVAQGEGQGAAAPHRVPVEVDPLLIHRGPAGHGHSAQGVHHAQQPPLGVVGHGADGVVRGPLLVVVISLEAEVPSLVLVKHVDVVGAPPRIAVPGVRAVTISAVAVEVDHDGGPLQIAAVLQGREHAIVVGVSQGALNGRIVHLKAQPAVVRRRGVEGGVPAAEVGVLHIHPAAALQGVGPDGERIVHLLLHRPQGVAGGDGPVLGAVDPHGGHGVIPKPLALAAEIAVGLQGPHQQALALSEGWPPILDREARAPARLPGVPLHVVVGVPAGGAPWDLSEQRRVAERIPCDGGAVSVDAVAGRR